MKIILKSIAIILGVSRLNEKYVHAMHLFAALLGPSFWEITVLSRLRPRPKALPIQTCGNISRHPRFDDAIHASGSGLCSF